MADADPRAGELTTSNYGWIKPNVGNSDDAWGGYINSDLDGIDTTVKSVSTVANAAYPATNPSGYQTAAQVAAAVPVVTTTTPAMDGTAAIGSTGKWADGGHVHPTDTSRYAASNPSNFITAATLPIASTTILGGVKVDGTTIKAAGDGTISTTVVPMGDNRIINGDMRIDQRGLSTGGSTATGYTVDRWFYNASQSSKGTWGNAAFFGASGLSGFPFFLGFVSSSAYAVLTADYFQFRQPIEADAVSDFAWGSASAQAVTLSFWAKSGMTGTFSGAISNAAVTRSYPFSFSLPSAATWTKIAITIPGDTAGTWVMSSNAAALYVQFDLGSGTTLRGPANAWASSNYVGATGSVSVVAANGAYFFVTGVKLEIGSVATPYNRQSLAKSMADCQRYYQAYPNAVVNVYAGTGNQISDQFNFQTAMRAAPTITPGTVTYSNASGFLANVIDTQSCRLSISITANGAGFGFTSLAISAEL